MVYKQTSKLTESIQGDRQRGSQADNRRADACRQSDREWHRPTSKLSMRKPGWQADGHATFQASWLEGRARAQTQNENTQAIMPAGTHAGEQAQV